MLNVNALMADMLAKGGITCPCCEDPMHGEPQTPAYITWALTDVVSSYASGKVFMRFYRLDVAIWLLDDAVDGQTLRDQALDALGGCRPAPGVTVHASHPTGVRSVDSIDARGMTFKAVIEENVWVTEREDKR